MLEVIFGSSTAEKVLMYIFVYGEGYATAISKTFDISLNQVQKQLLKFEEGGFLVSLLKGKTRIFTWNPRNPFVGELQNLLKKAYEIIPNDIKEQYYTERRRPRRTGKIWRTLIRNLH